MAHWVKKALKKIKKPIRKNQANKSLSDNLAYSSFCTLASNDYEFFKTFRRNPTYNKILEHVSEGQGQQYLDVLSEDSAILERIEEFRRNDDYGRPRQFNYPGVGVISPTTLRYIKVLADLKKYFQRLDGYDICEIGVGYGGQCRMVDSFFTPKRYVLVDIRPALQLAQRYLDNYVMHSVLNFSTMNELEKRKYDFVISNYAFTELPRIIQDVYLERVIMNSKHGYITYNEVNPVEFNSYKSDELLRLIPGANILEEVPLTKPKNCIILWGAK